MRSDKYHVGTLIEDSGKIGIICRIMEVGDLPLGHPVISWRKNYEIYYSNGNTTVMGEKSFLRLIEKDTIKILKRS